MKLDLGCGDRPYEDGTGWTHMDERELPHVEIVGNIEFLDEYVDERLDAIMARHVLEHFSHRETVTILENWRSVMNPGAVLHIEVPNLTWQVKAMVYGQAPDAEIVNLMYGAQDYPGNFHKTGFTWRTLNDDLVTAGFHDVTLQDIGMVLIAEGKA